MLFDWLVTGQIVAVNPAASVRGPKYVAKRGKTPVLKADEARVLLDSLDTNTIVGLRDRAILGIMCYTFARVSATVSMRIEDYFQNGKRWWFRLHEKGGKRHEVPAHHNAEAYTDAYIEAAGIGDEKKGPLFRSVNKHRQLTTNPITRTDVLHKTNLVRPCRGRAPTHLQPVAYRERLQYRGPKGNMPMYCFGTEPLTESVSLLR